MNVAANLLRFNNEKPGEVFHKIGYENHSSFAKAFKKRFGVSPNDYRSQNMIV
jgi:AraC-like DNA-binding protein